MSCLQASHPNEFLENALNGSFNEFLHEGFLLQSLCTHQRGPKDFPTHCEHCIPDPIDCDKFPMREEAWRGRVGKGRGLDEGIGLAENVVIVCLISCEVVVVGEHFQNAIGVAEGGV